MRRRMSVVLLRWGLAVRLLLRLTVLLLAVLVLRLHDANVEAALRERLHLHHVPLGLVLALDLSQLLLVVGRVTGADGALPDRRHRVLPFASAPARWYANVRFG